jgi:hypothetical protein
MLLRGMLDLGGGTGKRGYAALAARADSVQPLSPDLALTAGLGIGKILYGFILDSPTANVGFLGPEAGVLIGKDRALGRILIGLRGFVPIEAVPHPRDFAGQAVLPPHVMATVLLSL